MDLPFMEAERSEKACVREFVRLEVESDLDRP
jgi:hypothetical protein